MSLTRITTSEADFIQQAGPFIDHCLRDFGANSLSDLDSILDRPPCPIEPVLLDDYRSITVDEKLQLVRAYESEIGVAYFIALNPGAASEFSHSLFDVAAQLADDLGLHFPLIHPL